MRFLVVAMMVGCSSPGGVVFEGGAPAEAVLGEDVGSGEAPLRMALTLSLDGALSPGNPARWIVAGANPGETVRVVYSTNGQGAGPCPAQIGGQCLGILGPTTLFPTIVADATGTAVLAVNVPGSVPPGAALSLQAVAVRGVGGAASVLSPPRTDVVQDIVIDDFVHFPSAADLLFVVDDSGSMAEEQTALSNSFEPMIDTVLDLGLDYHVGVVSTDMSDPSKSGKLQPDNGGSLFIDPSDPNPAATFDEMASLGTFGSGIEEGLSAAFAALDTLGATHNLGFRRVTAQLAVIVLSDENDQSSISPTDFTLWIEGLAFHTGDITFSSIVTPIGNCQTGTSVGRRYLDVTDAVGGIEESICANDYGPALTTLAETLFTSVPYELSATADPATIVVTADEATGTIVVDPAAIVYDPLENTIRFTSAYHPPAGTDLHVTYERL
ncbi:MAG: vWA domain-containing protein [Myxococcota bacterium]